MRVVWADCPNHDLQTYRLDAYAIEVDNTVVNFTLSIENEDVVLPDLVVWEELLLACDAQRTLVKFEDWKGSWKSLIDLGLELHQRSIWRRGQIRRQIRKQETEIALGYAQMLRALERETGISVLWDMSHPLAKGMVSSGRGSEKIYRYIETQYYVQ
jgi:hypothetical protein